MKMKMFFGLVFLANFATVSSETCDQLQENRCAVGGQVLVENPETVDCGRNSCNRKKCCVDPLDPSVIETCADSFDADRCEVDDQTLMDMPETKPCGKNACNREKCCVDKIEECLEMDCDDENPETNDTCSLGVCSNVERTSCKSVNGLNWCYNEHECGEACNEVCGSHGLVPLADNIAWLDAQNTVPKCQAIADAFGISGISLYTFGFACLEDSRGDHTDTDLIGPLQCSTTDSCPEAHRTNADFFGSCDSTSSMRSICPCETPSINPPTPVAPTPVDPTPVDPTPVDPTPVAPMTPAPTVTAPPDDEIEDL